MREAVSRGAQTSQVPQGAENTSPKCSATCACRQTRDSAKATMRSARDSATSFARMSSASTRSDASSGAGSSSTRMRRPSS